MRLNGYVRYILKYRSISPRSAHEDNRIAANQKPAHDDIPVTGNPRSARGPSSCSNGACVNTSKFSYRSSSLIFEFSLAWR